MRKLNWMRIASLSAGLSAFLLTGCSRSPKVMETSEVWPAGAVAKVGGHVIYQAEVEKIWARRGISASKAQICEELMQQAALAEHARKAGLDKDPAMLGAWDALLAGAVIEREVETNRPSPSKSEVREWYASHSEEFRLPDQIRAGVLFLRRPAKAAAEQQAELKRRAEALYEQASTADGAGFGELTRQFSDDQASRYVGGDCGWITRGTVSERLPAPVIEAAFALDAKFKVAPLLETPEGFYVVRLIDVRKSIIKPLAEVQEGIKYRLAQAQRQEAQTKFFAGLKGEMRQEINQHALDAIPSPSQFAAGAPPPMQ